MSLPEGWRETTLGELINIFNTQRIPLSKQERQNIKGIYPYYGASNIFDYINDYIFDGEYLLISEDGENLNTRNTSIAFIVKGKFWVNNHAHVVQGKYKYLTKYLSLYFSKLDISPYITGAVQPKLSKTNLLNIPIVLSESISEQKAIASILSSFDEKIELLKEQNETLEQMAQGVFREWFVDGADESWEVKKLGEYIETNISTIKKNTELSIIQYLDTASLRKGMISSYQILNIEDAPSRAKREVKHLDILISTVRPDQNHYGIIRNPDKNVIVSTGYCVLTCNKINPYFVYLFLTTEKMTEYLHNLAEGSTSTYPSIKPIDIESLEFFLPSKEKLDAFFELADSYWEKIDCNYQQIQTLQKTRDILLPKLMSGELRVL